MPGKKADSSLLKSKSSDRSKRNDGGASGQQRPAYCISTTVSRGKWGTGNISGLHSEITPDRMTEDVRKLRSLYRYPKELNNAFSRAEATVGWDFRTNPQESKRSSSKRHKQAAKPFKVHFDLPNYCSPQQLVEKSLLQAKEAAEQQIQEHARLVEQYGEKGAAQIAYWQALKKDGPPQSCKYKKHVSAAERQVVLDLPDIE